MTPLELFSLPFMQRALLAALFTGLAAPAVGTYLVQRRLALMGDGLGHVAVTGVAIGLLTGTSPTWTAIAVAVLGALLIEVIRERVTPTATSRWRCCSTAASPAASWSPGSAARARPGSSSTSSARSPPSPPPTC